MVTRSALIVGILSCFMLLTASCKNQRGTVVEVDSLTGIVSSDPELSLLWGAIAAADMRDDLEGRRASKTLFAPTNAAFEALGQEEIDRLLLEENEAELQAILTNLIVDGAVTAPQLATGEGMPPQLQVGKDDTGAATVGGVRVVRSIRADDGYVHIMDSMILPGPVEPSGN